jgi:cytoskeletal protein RodZ
LGLTLEDIARTTRIATDYLKGLEEERWEELPPPVFAKGFIRAYCQAIGQAPDEALTYYSSIQEQKPSSIPAPSWSSQSRPVSSTLSISLVLVIVLGLGLAAVSVFFQKRHDQPAQRETPQSVPAPALPGPTVSQSLASLPPEEAPGALSAAAPRPETPRSRLVARTHELTWVKVTTDDGNVVQELLPPGSVREWTSSKRFILTVGNAGGITLEYNGKPLPSLGPSGAVVHDLVVPGPNEPTTP